MCKNQSNAFDEELAAMRAFIDILSAEPCCEQENNAAPQACALRPDTAGPCLSASELSALSRHFEDSFFCIPFDARKGAHP